MTDLSRELAAGIARYDAGDYAVAAGMFAKLLAQDPDDPTLLRLNGLALTRAGWAIEALPLLARARRLAWHEPLAHLQYGLGLLEADQPARAAAVLRRAAMLAPADSAVWINLSAALLTLGKLPAAGAAARRAVEHAPDMPEAYHALGQVELAAGDLAAAHTDFQHALSLRGNFGSAWLHIGLVRYRAGNIGGAMAAMRRALAIDPTNGAAEANLAAFLLLGGDTDEALRRLRSVLVRDPGNVPARLNLANALLLEGQAADALALLGGPVPSGYEGRHWRVHRALALIELGRWEEGRAELDAVQKPYGDVEILVLWRRLALAVHDDDAGAAAALVEQMEAALRKEGVSLPEHRIIGHFDLARFHHERHQSDAAFAHWTAGHRLLSRFQPYDRGQARAFTDASIAAFDAARVAGAGADNDDTVPVFIVGMPRSGTTLTEQILAAHRDVFGAGERSDVRRLVERIGGGASNRPETVHRLASADAEELTQAARDFLDELHALDPSARYVTDKMPANARYLGFLALLLPGARFIHCRRDPRDIGLSIFQHRFFGDHPYAHDLEDLGFAIGEHERLMAHWRALLGPRMIEVDLIEWVDQFSATLDRVLGFLDLPHDPACERFHEQERRVRTASAKQVRQPINRRGIGRHRAYAGYLQPLFAELERAGLVAATTDLAGS